MPYSHWIAVAALAFVPLAATAQVSRQPVPIDANASVPPVGYGSAFDTYRAAPEEMATPDQIWRTANEEITRQDKHGGHATMSGTGATMAEPKADAAPSDPHPGHHTVQGK